MGFLVRKLDTRVKFSWNAAWWSGSEGCWFQPVALGTSPSSDHQLDFFFLPLCEFTVPTSQRWKKMWDWRGGQRIRTYIILRGVCPFVKCRYVVSVFQCDWDVFAHKTVLPGWVTGEYYFILQHLWWLGWCHISYSLYTTSEKNVTLHIIEVKKTNFQNNGNILDNPVSPSRRRVQHNTLSFFMRLIWLLLKHVFERQTTLCYFVSARRKNSHSVHLKTDVFMYLM